MLYCPATTDLLANRFCIICWQNLWYLSNNLYRNIPLIALPSSDLSRWGAGQNWAEIKPSSSRYSHRGSCLDPEVRRQWYPSKNHRTRGIESLVPKAHSGNRNLECYPSLSWISHSIHQDTIPPSVFLKSWRPDVSNSSGAKLSLYSINEGLVTI